MIIIDIDPSTLRYRSLEDLAEQSLIEPGDYELIYEEQILFTTLRWGAIKWDEDRNMIMLEVFSTEDGEMVCEPIYHDYLAGEWVVPGFPNIGVDELKVQVRVNRS